MAVTETVTVGYGQRLGSSIKGVIGGIAVFIASFGVLFWNEGRAVKTAKALDEGEGACVAVESNLKVDSDYEGKFVHMTGRADTKDVLKDDVFGVSETGIRLARKVEIYQWVEHKEEHEKKNVGGSVTKTITYTYSQEWCRSAVSSAGFKEAGHENPPTGMEFKDDEWSAKDVSFGAFKLSEEQIAKIGAEKTYKLPADFKCKLERVQLAGDVIYVPEAGTRNNPLNNRDVQGQTRPGDMRVTYKVVMPHDVSIIARQRGESFVSFVAKNGRKLNMLQDGVASAEEMFADARTGNSILTWILRVVGFLLMAGGLKAVFKPLSVLADVLPILGDLMEVGLGLVANLVAFVLTVLTIAVAWLFYRPILGVGLLVLAGAGLSLLWKKRAAVKAKATQAIGAAKASAEPAKA